MPTVLSIAFAVLWVTALLPAAVLLAFRRRVDSAYWLIAIGFMVSWWADAFRLAFDIPWVVTHYYPAIQVGFFGLAFGAVWLPVAAVATALVLPVSQAGPELVVTTVGSIAVLWVSRSHVLRYSMLAYCGAATAFYLLLSTELASGRFMPLWYSYQASRLAGFGLFLGAAYHWREA